MRWIDHHCHLPDDADAAAALVEEASVAEVARLVDVGTDVASSQAARLRAHTYGAVWATAGVHPHDAKDVVTAGGTVDQLVDTLGRWSDAGADRVYLQVLDLDDLDHVRLLGGEVLPHLT